jgi:hypothetical protein
MKTERHHTTVQYLDKLKDLIAPAERFKLTDDILKLLVNSTHGSRIATSLENAQASAEKYSDVKNNVNGTELDRVYAEYCRVHFRLEELRNEQQQINAMEVKAHRRNLFYRAATTLTIGFSIMAVYAVAHWLEIPMPLMKVPLAVG